MPTTKQTNTSSTSSAASHPSSNLSADRDKLVADLKVLMADAKTLTSDATANSKEFANEKAEQLKAQLDETLQALKSQGQVVREKAVEKSEELEAVIRRHPWKALGIAVLSGVIIDRLTRK